MREWLPNIEEFGRVFFFFLYLLRCFFERLSRQSLYFYDTEIRFMCILFFTYPTCKIIRKINLME